MLRKVIHTYTRVKAALGRHFYKRAVEFPTKPYQFTHHDAERVYNIVLSGKLNHRFGPETSLLEKEFATYHKTKYALATNSGTSALEMAVKAIGIQPGDEVIVPAYTFVAVAQAVLSRGGVPVFADIDDTFTLSPVSVQEKISKRTKAIIVVHSFGNVADMDRILQLAKRNNLFVIEDCCQSVGASYKGKKTGSLGNIGCFSFNETKSIYTGQGGMFITSNKKFYDIANITRETGQIDVTLGSDVKTTGNTFALTEMQAALARSILSQLDNLNSRRKNNYELFTQTIGTQTLPFRWYRILSDAEPSFSRLIFMVDFQKLRITRNAFIARMQSQGVPMKTFYPIPLYKYSLFQNRRDSLIHSSFPFNQNKHVQYKGMYLPFAELFYRQQVGINFSPYLTRDNIVYFCTSFRNQMMSYL